MKFEFSPFVAIQVRDHEKAINFYKNVLSMEFNYTKDNDTYLKSGPMNFVFENTPEGRSGLPVDRQVFFEFKVDSMKEAKKILTDAGCKITREYSDKNMMFSDPFGMNFHVFEKGTFADA